MKHAAKMKVGFGYLLLESKISNWSNTAYLKTKVDMLLFTIKHCQNFELTIGHSAGVTVGKCMRMEMFCCCFFFRFDPAFFPRFSLSFPPFLGISYAGPFEPRFFGVDGAALRRYNDKLNIFGPKIWPFFLTLEAFRALPLHARELMFILLLPRILPY